MTEIGLLGELLEGRTTILRRDESLYEEVLEKIALTKRQLRARHKITSHL